MRVLKGDNKGRKLQGSNVTSIRATGIRVKTVFFDVLQDKINGCRFFDLCAGTGNIGIEALSRGASFVCFVDKSPRALRIIRKNCESTDMRHRSRVVKMEVSNVPKKMMNELFDIMYYDPPYTVFEDGFENEALLLQEFRTRLLAAGGFLAVETRKTCDLHNQPGFIREKKIGDTKLSFFSGEDRHE